MRKSTACVHTPKTDLSRYTGTATPLFTATAYEYVGVENYVYPRYFNTPNLNITEEKIASLEGAEKAILFSSGMAATMTVLYTLVRSGDHILLQEDIYGGTIDAVRVEMEKMGVGCSFVKGNVQEMEKAIKPSTRVIFFESPSNPLMGIVDIASVTELAKRHNIITVFDNTFASPINQNPHELGVNFVIQSATKYLGGHSDICAGVATMSEADYKRTRETGIHLGGNPDPYTAWQLERSIKTLKIRVERQSANALELATWMQGIPGITKVNYPGLPSHPGHEIARKQMTAFGGMLSFEVQGDADAFVERLEIISPVMSLGGVETTVTNPVQTSHARISASERERLGIRPNLLRLSVGIEDIDDLKEDILRGLGQK